MARALIAVAITVVAIGVAALIRRREPAGPPVDSFPTPRQLHRVDFARPDAPWLVALFSSTTCGSCPDLAAKIAPLDSPLVAVTEVTYQDQRDVHDRYGISAVPMVVVADADGVVRAAFVGPTSATDIWAAVAELRAPGATGAGADAD
jgi:thioredoxin-like negative regulator of GroEL